MCHLVITLKKLQITLDLFLTSCFKLKPCMTLAVGRDFTCELQEVAQLLGSNFLARLIIVFVCDPGIYHIGHVIPIDQMLN